MKSRFISFAILFFAGILLVGCDIDKNEASEPQKKGLTVTIGANVSFDKDFVALSRVIAHEMASDSAQGNPGGVARVVDADGHKYFADGDRIAFVYTNTSGETVVALSNAFEGFYTDDGEFVPIQDAANFYWEVTDPDETKNFTLIYPSTMCNSKGTIGSLDNQSGSLTSGTCKDLATYVGSWNYKGNSENMLEDAPLTNPLTVCKFTITDNNGMDITGSITDLRISEKNNGYVITRQAGPGPIYVFMKEVKKKPILFTAKIGDTHYVKYVKDKTLKAGNMNPITVAMYAPDLHNGPLPGIFTTYAYRRRDNVPYGVLTSDKHFQFSPGNLRATTNDYGKTWSWSFASNQWENLGGGGANLSLYNNHAGYCKKNGTIDLFGWSNSLNTFGICADYSTFPCFNGSFHDWGYNKIAGDGGVRWRTPGGDEWDWLLSGIKQKSSTVNGVANARSARGRVNNVNGLILFPDLYIQPAGVKAPTGINNVKYYLNWEQNNYRGDDWRRMEVAGAVFLPAAGWQHNETEYRADEGMYWTCTTQEVAKEKDSQSTADALEFDASGVYPWAPMRRSFGLSVRLVHYVNVDPLYMPLSSDEDY